MTLLECETTNLSPGSASETERLYTAVVATPRSLSHSFSPSVFLFVAALAGVEFKFHKFGKTLSQFGIVVIKFYVRISSLIFMALWHFVF